MQTPKKQRFYARLLCQEFELTSTRKFRRSLLLWIRRTWTWSSFFKRRNGRCKTWQTIVWNNATIIQNSFVLIWIRIDRGNIVKEHRFIYFGHISIYTDMLNIWTSSSLRDIRFLRLIGISWMWKTWYRSTFNSIQRYNICRY